MKNSIYDLQNHGLITDIIGSIPNTIIKPALVMWARKEPKEAFHQFITISKVITQEPLTVFVDDICTRLIFDRTQTEQEHVNKLYQDFFDFKGCNVKFSSTLYDTQFTNNLLYPVIELGAKLSINEFLRCLPKHKRNDLSNITAVELFHTLLELLLFEQVTKNHNLLLVGHFSQAIVTCHRKLSNNPLSAIVIPKLTNNSKIKTYQKMVDRFQK